MMMNLGIVVVKQRYFKDYCPGIRFLLALAATVLAATVNGARKRDVIGRP